MTKKIKRRKVKSNGGHIKLRNTTGLDEDFSTKFVEQMRTAIWKGSQTEIETGS